ncbi:hypothetical protein GQ44DRAFT_769539 [Phaeosphaeriaceae sp. PMI808]|nr:hypothetical protein GQ44DRAFT_769539 [Phaeosphaeriaceae sp. PMI808]
MVPPIYNLPQTPQLNGNTLQNDGVVVDKAPNSQDEFYQDGFFPVGTATLVPRPWKTGFTWTTANKRPLVATGIATEEKPLTFKVVLYQGLGLNYPNSEQRFVYIGALDRITTSARKTYIKVQDLAKRIGDGCKVVYQADMNTFNKFQNKIQNNPGEPFTADAQPF